MFRTRCIFRKSAVALLGASLLLALSSAGGAFAESPPYEDNYGGIWRTGWEDVMFSMDYQGGVRGAFGAGQNGRFVGTVRVQRLRANWAADQGEVRCAEPRWGSPYWGEVVMDFSDDAQKLSGIWGACGETPDRPFTGRRLSPMEMNARVALPAGKALPDAPVSMTPPGGAPPAPAVGDAAGNEGLPLVGEPGPDVPPQDFPQMPHEYGAGSGYPDPAKLLPPDTALDDTILGKTWETDALLDRAPEKALPVGWVYRMAYASYLPVNEDGPLLDMRVFTGQDPALNMLESAGREALGGGEKAEGVVPGAFRGLENGRSVLWLRTGKALVRISAPEAGQADALARIVLRAQ